LFWLALAMLSLCVRDLVSLLVHRSQPPTFENLPGGTKWWTRIIADPARRWLGAYQGLVGIAGLIGGAVLGHFLWKPCKPSRRHLIRLGEWGIAICGALGSRASSR